MPDDLTLNDDGTITGTCQPRAGTFAFTAQVVDTPTGRCRRALQRNFLQHHHSRLLALHALAVHRQRGRRRPTRHWYIGRTTLAFSIMTGSLPLGLKTWNLDGRSPEYRPWRDPSRSRPRWWIRRQRSSHGQCQLRYHCYSAAADAGLPRQQWKSGHALQFAAGSHGRDSRPATALDYAPCLRD